jgi:hypothetical protein
MAANALRIFHGGRSLPPPQAAEALQPFLEAMKRKKSTGDKLADASAEAVLALARNLKANHAASDDLWRKAIDATLSYANEGWLTLRDGPLISAQRWTAPGNQPRSNTAHTKRITSDSSYSRKESKCPTAPAYDLGAPGVIYQHPRSTVEQTSSKPNLSARCFRQACGHRGVSFWFVWKLSRERSLSLEVQCR